MSQNDISAIAQKALKANTKKGFLESVSDWARDADFIELMFMLIGVSALVCITAFESVNSARGWVLIAAGSVPAFIAIVAGAALPVGYIMFHRRASERYRRPSQKNANKNMAVAIALTIATLFGVFSNVAGKSASSSNTAKETNTSRALLIAEQRGLKAEVAPEKMLEYKALLDVNQRLLSSKENEAKAWGMRDGATLEECAADLRVKQRQICNSLNGDADGTQMGLRNEVALNQLSIETFLIKQKRLAEIDEELKGLQFDENNAHWGAMSDLTSSSVEDDTFRIWGVLFLSVVFLFIAGFGWDSLLEKIEEEEGET